MATRIFRAGGGTTLPGLLAEKIDPEILRKLSGRIKHGVIVVTGTNGKTTASKMLSKILSEEGYSVLHNSAGSNLTRGVASAMVRSANIFGTRLREDVAVFEIDEATMPEATSQLRPDVVLVTNLFRDQLDRYGELDKTVTVVGSSLRGFSEMTVVLNADDPLVSSLADYVEGKAAYYGIEDGAVKTDSEAAMDSRDCLYCGHELKYQDRYLGHLGRWKCTNCKKARKKPAYSASDVKLSPLSSVFNLWAGPEKIEIKMPLPGLYNVYNGLSAAAAASVIGVGVPAVSYALRHCKAAFGRMESIEVEGKKIMLLLVKNPIGATQALSAIYSDAKPKKVGLILNDNFADGTDISWIWDVDFEYFDLKKSRFLASGIRGEEMALRLKYAGVEKKDCLFEKDPVLAVKKLADLLEPGETGYVLPTYTAMTEIRGAFVSRKDRLANVGRATKRGL